MSKLFIILPILALFFSCGKKDNENTATKTPTEQLSEKFDTYSNLVITRFGPEGFIETSECDATLFTGLLASVNTFAINFRAAEKEPGLWYRRPLSFPECYVTGGSGSTISRDMLIGVYWYAWTHKDLKMLNDLWMYAVDHTWVMGEGDMARTVLTVRMVSTLTAMINRMGGSTTQAYESVDPAWSFVTNYEAQLVMLHILLRGLVFGGITDREVEVLKEQIAYQPRNPLAHAVLHRFTDGDQTDATKLLLNTALWPSNALPTSANYCTRWYTERDGGADWEPCNEGKTHTGGDFLFTAAVILGKI